MAWTRKTRNFDQTTEREHTCAEPNVYTIRPLKEFIPHNLHNDIYTIFAANRFDDLNLKFCYYLRKMLFGACVYRFSSDKQRKFPLIFDR